MDYRKFLGQASETLVMPYLGGNTVQSASRRYRVRGRNPMGWASWSCSGRNATRVGESEPPDMTRLPSVRGHFACGWLFTPKNAEVRVWLVPPPEPEPLCRLVAAKWHDGSHVFSGTDFDDEPELLARQALEERDNIAELKGASPGLRRAFAFALLTELARAEDMSVSLLEVRGLLPRIATQGPDAAREQLARLRTARREETRREHVGAMIAGSRALPSNAARERAENAVEKADADFLSFRMLDHYRADVAFRIQGERFVATVDINTLQILDAGVCLSGTDSELTLDSLPSAIREAIATDQLVITRH